MASMPAHIMQVAQFLTRAPQDEAAALRALNSMLPRDIRALAVQRVPLDFNVRYALRKTYHYDVHTQPVADPFTLRFRCHPRHAEMLDVEAMRWGLPALASSSRRGRHWHHVPAAFGWQLL